MKINLASPAASSQESLVSWRKECVENGSAKQKHGLEVLAKEESVCLSTPCYTTHLITEASGTHSHICPTTTTVMNVK